MTDLVTTIPPVAPEPTVGFISYPTDLGIGGTAGPEVAYTVDGNTYHTGIYANPYNHPTTFDTRGYTFAAGGADPTTPKNGAPAIVEYHWDFGDGDFAYGPVVQHKFRAYNPQTRVTLRVTDAKGRRFFVSAQANLVQSLLAVRRFSEAVTGTDSLGRKLKYKRTLTDTRTTSDSVSYSLKTQFGAYENEVLV